MSISPEEALGMVEAAVDRMAPYISTPFRAVLGNLTFADRADLAEELARLMEEAVQSAITDSDW